MYVYSSVDSIITLVLLTVPVKSGAHIYTICSVVPRPDITHARTRPTASHQ